MQEEACSAGARWRVWTLMHRLDRAAALLALGLLAGCLSVPDGMREGVSAKGAVGVSARPFLWMTLVRTISFTPGPTSRLANLQSTRCNDTRNALQLRWPADLALDVSPESICRSGLQALAYASGYSGLDRNDVTFTMTLVPPGAGAMVKRSSSNLLGPASARFVTPFAGASAGALAELQTTLAHESIHIAAAFNRQPLEDMRNEEIAYLAGYCATLHALGSIDDVVLARAVVTAEAAFPDSAVRSSQAGVGVAQIFRDAMEDNRLTLGSRRGKKISAYCDSSLRAFFGGHGHGAN